MRFLGLKHFCPVNGLAFSAFRSCYRHSTDSALHLACSSSSRSLHLFHPCCLGGLFLLDSQCFSTLNFSLLGDSLIFSEFNYSLNFREYVLLLKERSSFQAPKHQLDH